MRAVVFVAILGATVPLLGQTQAAEVYRRQSEAFRSGGLRATAAVTGQFEHTWNVEFNFVQDVEALVKGSPLIVVASARSGRGHLGPSQSFVVTEYELDVHQYIKGSAPPSGRVLADYVGGRVTFADGNWVSDKPAPDVLWRHPKAGEQMLLFLRPLEGRYAPHQQAGDLDLASLHIVAGTYSVFFENNGKVESALSSELFDKPCTGPTRIFTWTKCQTWATFIETVKSYVRAEFRP